MCKVIEENGTFILRDDWNLEDIQNQASNMDIELTENQALKVMHWIAFNHDANYGITWDTIDFAIERVVGDAQYENMEN